MLEETFGACGVFLGEPFFSSYGDDDVRILTWRGDPIETLSDSNIVVVADGFDSKTYHVHKSILCHGQRSSRFFSRVFLEESRLSTKIELDKRDFDSFPMFLDFMYETPQTGDDDRASLEFKTGLTISQAVSLRHLAKVFESDGLMLAVNKFIQKDLSLKTGPAYLAQAHIYEDDKLINSSKRLCIENFSRLDSSTITRLPLKLFRSIVLGVIERFRVSEDVNVEEEDSLSSYLCAVICQYFEKYPNRLTTEILLELTDEVAIPNIDSEHSIQFMSFIRDLNPKGIRADSEEWEGLVDLSQRCARSVAEEHGWKDFNIKSALEEYIYGPCASHAASAKFESLLFATSFAATLESAQKELRASENVSNASKHRVKKLQREHSDLREEVNRYKRDLDVSREEVIRLKQQLNELKRRQVM